MWEAGWLNKINSPFSELSHHGIKGMRWGVRKERSTGIKIPTRHVRIEKSPEEKAMLKARRKKIIRRSNGILVAAGTIAASREIAKYGPIPVKTITGLAIKGTVKISDSKSPATLAGKLAIDAITADVWKRTFSTLSTELDEINAMSPEQRSEEIRKAFNKTK